MVAIPHRVRSTIALLILAIVGGCGGSDSGTEPTGSFALAVSPGALSLAPGSDGSVTVTITRAGGFTGAVTITVQGLPTGVTPSPLQIGADATSGSLTLTAAPTAQSGSTTLTVQGTGSGVSAQTAPLTLTVTSQTTPDFAIVPGSSSTTVAAGAQVTVPITVQRSGGFTGPVALTVTGLPAGVTATFNPATVAAGTTTSSLVLSATGAAPAATATVNINGSATGVGQRTASVSLQVTASPPPSGNIVWQFCGRDSELPIWLAVQDGTGPWTRITGSNNRYQFDIASNRGGVAWIANDASSGLYAMQVLYLARDEFAIRTDEVCGAAGAGKTVTANVAGVAVGETALLSLGGVNPLNEPTSTVTNATFPNVPNGPIDLLGGVAGINLQTFALTPRKFILRRGLNPANNSALAPIDFNGTEAFDPVQRTLTLSNAGGDFTTATVGLHTAGGAFGVLYGGTATGSWYGLPADRLMNGDIHYVAVTSSGLVPLAPSRSAVRHMASAQNLSIAFGPHLTGATGTVLAGVGHARGRASYPIQPDYDRHWYAFFQQAGGGGRVAIIQMTRGYRGSGTGTVEIEIPELNGTAGWTPAWGLQTGSQTVWGMTGQGWTAPGGVVHAPWIDGAEYRSATTYGQFVP